jgi:hypothetical protein
MTTLLDHAIDAAKRLPLDRQNNVAEALLALIENEAQPRFDIQPTGDEPGEAEILALMPKVMPSVLPSKAEVAAWNRLPEEEQVRRYREALNQPGSDEAVDDTIQDIYARVLDRHGL